MTTTNPADVNHALAADYAFMAHAIQLAERGRYTAHPNPCVGCVIVRDGEVVGEGWHARTGEAHAEVNALAEAGDRSRGATVYVTLEPCNHQGRTPPCTEALLSAGVARVVAAIDDPDPGVAGGGLERLREAGVATTQDIMVEPARALNRGFLKRTERGRPWVRLKLAQSIDGATAMASGESQWITGEAARRDVQRLRARSACVLSAIGTVHADDPQLNVRLSAEDLGIEGSVRQPLRAVLDTHLRIAANARVLSPPAEALVITASDVLDKGVGDLADTGVTVRGVARSEAGLDLEAVLGLLADEFLVNEVQVEAGAGLAGSLLAASLVDELVCYVAPHLMGSSARPLALLPLETMHQRVAMQLADCRQVGADLRLTWVPARPAGQASS